jgi:hypothetical protein
MRFLPSMAWCVGTGNAAVRAFAFQGRCFELAVRAHCHNGWDNRGPMPANSKHRSAVRARRRQLMGLPGPHPRNTADRVRLPVLTPHAPSRKPKAIYRVPARGVNPPDSSGAGGSGESLHARTAHRGFPRRKWPQVGGLTSDSSRAGQGTLVKARGTVSRPLRVGRFPGVGVVRPQHWTHHRATCPERKR